MAPVLLVDLPGEVLSCEAPAMEVDGYWQRRQLVDYLGRSWTDIVIVLQEDEERRKTPV